MYHNIGGSESVIIIAMSLLTTCCPTLTTLVADLFTDGLGCTGGAYNDGQLLVQTAGPNYCRFATSNLPAGRPRGQISYFNTNNGASPTTLNLSAVVGNTMFVTGISTAASNIAALNTETSYLYTMPGSTVATGLGKLRYTGTFTHLALVTATCWYRITNVGIDAVNLTFRLAIDPSPAASTTSFSTLNYTGFLPPVVLGRALSSSSDRRTSITISAITTVIPNMTFCLTVGTDRIISGLAVFGFSLESHMIA